MRLPRAYDDLRRATPIASLPEVADGTVVLVRGRVRRLHVFPRRLLDVFVEEGDAVLRARWFRVPSAMAKSFPKGSEVALAGALRTATDGTRELCQPSVVTAALAARGDGGLGLRPRYGLVQGVKGRLLERMRGAALARLGGSPDGGADRFDLVPAATRLRLGLPTLAEALTRVHAPADEDAARLETLALARRRLAFEAALVAQLAFLLRRAAAAPGRFAVAPTLAAATRVRVEAALAFALTGTQARALDEIAADSAAPRPMRRLLVGDVGSGKTAVAFGAAALMAAAGAGTLMMVPTEVLAEQQLRALGPLGTRLGIGIAALTGATPAATRAAILEDCGRGRVQLLLGTQALLGVAGELPRLGLVIVDEQHRFGVAQRSALGRSVGSQLSSSPHLLSMSATPIPRSLALALHGDLDASFLTERPGGRPPPTAIVCGTGDERGAAYARLRDALAEGNQAFVVCPVREEARRPGAVTAIAQHARLRRALAPSRVGLLHGALAAAAKEEALRAFADGRTDVLVATTVVELGIDVPNATVMIVEEADRLGLAQLHQLRGRVGRGGRAGLCFLFASDGLPPDAPGWARLRLCAELDDGFRLAEADLAARGFGDLWGTAQAGEGEGDGALGTAGLAEFAELTALGRREAEALLASDPALAEPAHAALAEAARARTVRLFAGEAG